MMWSEVTLRWNSSGLSVSQGLARTGGSVPAKGVSRCSVPRRGGKDITVTLAGSHQTSECKSEKCLAEEQRW